MAENPCQSCGACCGHFRVSFYWRETEPSERTFPVPVELTEDVSTHLRCMKGTNQKHYNRCVALEGKVGTQVSCSIYLHRPSPCREFSYSYENGIRNPRCDEARGAYGLPPLRPNSDLVERNHQGQSLRRGPVDQDVHHENPDRPAT